MYQPDGEDGLGDDPGQGGDGRTNNLIDAWYFPGKCDVCFNSTDSGPGYNGEYGGHGQNGSAGGGCSNPAWGPLK